MANAYSAVDLLGFLDHAGDKGLMPAATAQALAVASRNILGVLTQEEQEDLSKLDIAAVIRRFNNKRAKDFNPASLKEYGRRLNRAVDLFLGWREDPANFSVKTRATGSGRKSEKKLPLNDASNVGADEESIATSASASYQSALPVRPGVVISLTNIPNDLTKAEAARVANFVSLLAMNDSGSNETSRTEAFRVIHDHAVAAMGTTGTPEIVEKHLSVIAGVSRYQADVRSSDEKDLLSRSDD